MVNPKPKGGLLVKIVNKCLKLQNLYNIFAYVLLPLVST